jgi:tetratricopeptide (TPR) repeat protein
MKALLLSALVPALAVAQAISPDGGALPPPEPPHPWIEVPIESTDKPCTVDALDIDAKVDGLHARVSTTITIRNPNARPISAPLAFPLPDGATVCGYALEIGGAMVDGVVVPKEKARVAFETEQRRGVDPGLVEAVKGNVYRTRVYPVPANGTRRVRVDYVAPIGRIANDGAADLALPSLPAPLARRSVNLEVADWTTTSSPFVWRTGDGESAPVRFEMSRRFWRSSFADTNVAAGAKLFVGFPYTSGSPAIERAPDGTVWFCAAVGRAGGPPFRLEEPAAAGGGLSSFTVFWDASASRGGDHAADLKALLALAPDGATGPFRLVVFRNAPEPARTFDTVAALVDAILCTPYDGGTDFAALAPALAATEGPVLLFSDGLDTLSGKPLDFGGRKDVAAFVSGAERDVESLRQACGGLVFDTAEPVSLSLRDGALVAAGASYVAGFEGTGVADVQGVGPFEKDRGVLIGRLVADETELRIRVRDARGETLSEPIKLAKNRAVAGSTLATAWAAMRVQQLAPRADDNADDLLAIGRRFGVASPATSLLVLESLDQWLRHDIEPPATLPQMREQWFAAKKNRPGEDPEAKAARHLEMLKGQWKQRMEWWNTDFSKVKPPEPAGKRRAIPQDGMAAPDDDDGDDMVMAEEADEAPVAMAASSEGPVIRAQRDPGIRGRALAAYGGLARAAAPAAADRKSAPSAPSAGSISVKAWSPDTPYLKALDAAGEEARAVYIARRWGEWSSSPAFFLDCAGWFFAKGDHEFGVRVLSNLAELRIEDPALLRVMAWRLKEAAGEFIAKMRLCGTWFGFLPGSSAQTYEQAIAILRRVCKLRPEDAQSWRDLALALDEYGREALPAYAKPEEAVDNLAEALDLYRKVALTPWARHPDSISLFAVEEHNALYAWCTNRATGGAGGEAPRPLPEGLEGLPDCDMRVVMSWDADETDVDLHVTEPSGEEAYYGHRRTRAGGDVSKDITDGYGPEEYLIRKAPAGGYRIRAHYYASHQQEVFGPATATATIFTDWGRPNQAFQTLSIRLDKAREMIDLGTVQIGGKEGVTAVPAAAAPALRKDMAVDEVKALFGDPAATEGDTLAWSRPGGRTLKATFADGKLVRAVEVLPGGAETILVQ